MVTGNDSKKARKRAIDGFKSGAIQALVNAAVLTEGLIFRRVMPLCWRAPVSPSLYIQIVGRALVQLRACLRGWWLTS